MIQVRYGENSPIAKKLRSEFRSTWEYVETSKALPENINRKVTIKVPTDIQEYLVFNASAVPGIFIVDCLTREYQMSSVSIRRSAYCSLALAGLPLQKIEIS